MKAISTPTTVFTTFVLLFIPTLRADLQNFQEAGQVSKEDVESSLLAELTNKLRPGAQSDRINQFEGELRSMYSSLPKSANGGLDHNVVRYALHRLLVQRHGWFVKGLEPDSDAKGQEAAAGLKEWVPSYLQAVLESRTAGRGFDLSELAALAATLEDLVHDEAIQRLKYIYEVMGLSMEERVDGEQAHELVDMFTMAYLRGGNFTASSAEEAALRLGIFMKKYPGWKEVDEFVQTVMDNVTGVSDAADVAVLQLDFNTSVRIVEEIGARFHQFNDLECRDLKTTLLQIEDQKKQGRVKLTEFYKMGLHTHWQFTEKIDYLRTLGALDESDPSNPAVLVANYLGSRPQCLEASGFYAVCCRNECEDLMGSIESEVAEPFATPERIVELVSKLTSDTVKQARKLSATLVSRLHQVAAANGGRVPLHGRLFAQWIHHAFPRECPYPHVGGSNPETPDEWMQRTGSSSTQASEEEMMGHVSPAKAATNVQESSDELPWTEEEELLVQQPEVVEAPKTQAPKTVQAEAPKTQAPKAVQQATPRQAPLPVQQMPTAEETPARGVFNQKMSPEAERQATEALVAVNRVLRTLVLSGAALGLAAASRLAIPKVDNQTAKKKEQIDRGWWATLVLLLVPLVVVCFDHLLDWSSSHEFLLCGLCWGLAALIICQLQASYGSFMPASKKDDDYSWKKESSDDGIGVSRAATDSHVDTRLKRRPVGAVFPDV